MKQLYNPTARYPNQLTCAINKELGDVFMQVNLNDIRNAVNNLSQGTFKLWLYLAENQNNFIFNLSPKDFIDTYNVSDSTYRRAKKELLEKGYLIQEGNDLNFYAKPIDLTKNKEEILLNKVEQLGNSYCQKTGLSKIETLKQITTLYPHFNELSRLEKLQILYVELQKKIEVIVKDEHFVL